MAEEMKTICPVVLRRKEAKYQGSDWEFEN
jgi:hypothetical protein